MGPGFRPGPPRPYPSAVATVPTARPPLWRDVRILRVLGQAVFVVLLVVVARETFLNLRFGVEEQGLDLSFDFLQQRVLFELRRQFLAEFGARQLQQAYRQLHPRGHGQLRARVYFY